jgi:hypothetical protein
MVEAANRSQQAPTTSHAQGLAQRQAHAVAVLVRRAAIAGTKQRLRSQGLKPQYMPMREIAVMAEDYVAQHRPKLIAEARVIVDRWTEEGFFGKRSEGLSRRDFRCVKLTIEMEQGNDSRLCSGFNRRAVA